MDKLRLVSSNENKDQGTEAVVDHNSKSITIQHHHHHINSAPKFSEITSHSGSAGSSSHGSSSNSSGTVRNGGKKLIGTVSKKLNMKKNQAKIEAAANAAAISNGDAFTITEIEDGKRSVRHLQGRRQSANILFVPKKLEDIENNDNIIDIADHATNNAYIHDRPMFIQVSKQLFV